MIRTVSVGVTAVSLGLLAGCGSSATKTAPSGAHSQQTNTVLASVSQTLGSAPPAITYDPALAAFCDGFNVADRVHVTRAVA